MRLPPPSRVEARRRRVRRPARGGSRRVDPRRRGAEAAPDGTDRRRASSSTGWHSSATASRPSSRIRSPRSRRPSTARGTPGGPRRPLGEATRWRDVRGLPAPVQAGRAATPRKRRVNCHRRIGSALLRRRFDQHQATVAISHLHRACEFDRAGGLLFMVLAAALRETRELPDDPIFGIWSAVDLPGGMNLNVRLVIRAVQVEIAKRRGRPTEYLLTDLSRLRGRCRPGPPVRTHGGRDLYGDTRRRRDHVGRARRDQETARSPRRATRATVPTRSQGRRGVVDSRRVSPSVASARADPRHRLVTEAVRLAGSRVLLPDAERRILFVPEDTSLFFPAAADFLITGETEEAQAERGSAGIHGAIEAFGDRALEGGCEDLWASAVRARPRPRGRAGPARRGRGSRRRPLLGVASGRSRPPHRGHRRREAGWRGAERERGSSWSTPCGRPTCRPIMKR